MSGYNNFSYFNATSSANQWWSVNDTTKTFDANMNNQQFGNQFQNSVQYTEFNNQAILQNIVPNYGQPLTKPKDVLQNIVPRYGPTGAQSKDVLQSPTKTAPKDARTIESTQPRHEVIQGKVTQLFSNFGYINDNIIFSKSDVIGSMVSIGDKVAVDATFQPNNPTKFKGERVYKIDDSRAHTIPNAPLTTTNTSTHSPFGNRWDVQKVGQPIISRSEVPSKVQSAQASFSRSDVIAQNVQNTFSQNALPIQINIPPFLMPKPLKSRFDVTTKKQPEKKDDQHITSPGHESISKKQQSSKNDGHYTPVRFEINKKKSSDNKNNNQSLSARIDLTVRSRSDSRTESPKSDSTSKYRHNSRNNSPKSDSTSKYRADNRNKSPKSDSTSKFRSDKGKDSPKNDSTKFRSDSKNSSHPVSPRDDTNIKSRLSLRNSTVNSSPNKRSTAELSKNTNDKLKKKMDKIRNLEVIPSKRAKRQKLRKSEALKRKAISPIRFKITQKTLPKEHSAAKSRKSSAERRSRSVDRTKLKNFESFAHRELDCAAVKNQFRSLTVPQEFFHISLKYQQSFPLNHPLKLGQDCPFRVLDKKVKSIDPAVDAQLRKDIDPKDADTTFVAKVMLLSTNDLVKFYKDTLTFADDLNGANKISITKDIKFLVATLGDDKEFAIGGAWSPSLDGADPETNPRVLINTAIRTCKAMTGVDLSNCSSWPKFLELHYYRPMQTKKESIGKMGPDGEIVITDDPIEYTEPRMETVVYFLPDVWNCVPSKEGWKNVTRSYMEQLTCIMCPPPVSIRPIGSTTSSSSVNDEVSEVGSSSPEGATDQLTKDRDSLAQEEEGDGDDKSMHSDGGSMNEQPTHFSKLVVAGMKIVEIKKELELRNLSNKGVMEQLKARLKSAMDREEAEEKSKVSHLPEEAEPVSTVNEATTTVLSDGQKNDLKKFYSFATSPEIIVHQNRKIYDNKMKIRTISLHSLLSYYDVDLQENTFELAVFSKQFLAMLRRDAVFHLYKSIVVANEVDLRNTEDLVKKSKLSVTTSKVTINKPLLFSCTLLDKEKTNKIPLEDLRLMIEGLGICLSTNQLSLVLDKVKDSGRYLYYRRLTDKEMTDADLVSLLNEDVSEDLEYIKELAMGNKALFESEAGMNDIPMTEDEVDRLRSELDRSERCRRAVEYKVSYIRGETKKNIDLAIEQAKEITKLKEQLSGYKTKYSEESERCSRYRGNYDRLLRQVKDIDVMAASLNKAVSDTVAKHEGITTKKIVSTVKTSRKIKVAKKSVPPQQTAVIDTLDLTKNVDLSEESPDSAVAEQLQSPEASESLTQVDQPEQIHADGVDTADYDMVTDDVHDSTLSTESIPQETAEIVTETACVVDAASSDPVVMEEESGQGDDEFDLSKVSDYDLMSVDEVDM